MLFEDPIHKCKCLASNDLIRHSLFLVYLFLYFLYFLTPLRLPQQVSFETNSNHHFVLTYTLVQSSHAEFLLNHFAVAVPSFHANIDYQ